MLCVLFALLAVRVLGFSNPAIQENELGLTATACADAYCNSLGNLQTIYIMILV
jgi:hypothetical protein